MGPGGAWAEGLELEHNFSGAQGGGWAGVIVSVRSGWVTDEPTPKSTELKQEIFISIWFLRLRSLRAG